MLFQTPGNLVHEKIRRHDLFYYYDADGSVGSISYDYTRYAFRKNLQGDVIAILDTNGDVVARYAYDAWGKVLSVTDKDGNTITDANHVANINPIRYRGYYYDTETGWYYLNSRYYDPSVKRFINADDRVGQIGAPDASYNLFAYCINNPVSHSDPTGRMIGILSAILITAEVALVGIVAIAAIDILANALPKIEEVPHLTLIIPLPKPEPKPEPEPEPDNNEHLDKIPTPMPEADDGDKTKVVIFPANPHMFLPRGMTLSNRPGTKNGKFIFYQLPGGHIVFRWDENINYSNGPHYHILDENGGEHHYYAGDVVPEPYASLYF